MTTVLINRGEKTVIPFNITDANNGLAGARVTAALAVSTGAKAALAKASGLPGSTADITITSQTAGAIAGTINFAVADFNTLAAAQYYLSLWVDDGLGNDRCVTPGGVDTMQIVADVPRA